MITLYLIRHGETDANKTGTLQGQQNTLLNSNGLNQALQLAQQCQSLNLHQLYSSDLQRASDTAKAIATHCQLTPNLTTALRELRFGSLEGLRYAQLSTEQQGQLAKLYTQQIDLPCPHAESLTQLTHRLQTFIANLPQQPNQNHAVISHGYTLKHLLHLLLSWSKQHMHLLELRNCSLTQLSYRQKKWQLIRLNQPVKLQ